MNINVEQGARDSLRLAVNALFDAEKAQSTKELLGYVHTALDNIGQALSIQKLEPLDFQHPFIPRMAQAAACLLADRCEVCLGDRGGVRGNENFIDGHTMCDYCTVSYQHRPLTE